MKTVSEHRVFQTVVMRWPGSWSQQVEAVPNVCETSKPSKLLRGAIAYLCLTWSRVLFKISHSSQEPLDLIPSKDLTKLLYI